MLNVDAGNSRHRPDNPRELRASWRLTLWAIVGFALFVLLFMGIRAMGDDANDDGDPRVAPGSEAPRSPGPGEREGPNRPRTPGNEPRP